MQIRNIARISEIILNPDYKNFLPQMDSASVESLKHDIKEHGIRIPLIINPQNVLLDGHTRLQIAKELGFESVPVEVRKFEDEVEEKEFIIQVNLHRRHLNNAQKAELALKLLELEKRRAKVRQLAGLKQYSENSVVVPDVSLSITTPDPEVIPVDSILNQRNKDNGRARNIVAGKAGISVGTIHKVEKIKALAKEDKEIANEWKKALEGKTTINKVYQKVKLRELKEKARILESVPEVSLSIAIQDSSEINPNPEYLITDQIEVKTGDIWKLGNQILICGDNTNSKVVEYISQNHYALAFADPPYGSGKTDYDLSPFTWEHDYLEEISDIVAVTCGISSIKAFMQKTTMNYRWSLACHITNGMTRSLVGFGNWIYTAIFSKKDSIYSNAKDFHEVSLSPKDSDGKYEKRQKPFGFLLWILELFTKEGDMVLDAFSGSGAMQIVCETQGRKSVGIEVIPELCTEIIRRFKRRFPEERVEILHRLAL